MTTEELNKFNEPIIRHQMLVARKETLLRVLSNNVMDTDLHELWLSHMGNIHPKNMFYYEGDYKLFLDYKESLRNRLKEINSEIEILLLNENIDL